MITTTSSSTEYNSSDIGIGFVVLIEKDDNTRTEDDLQFNISKTIFLDKIGDTVCIPPNVLHCHGL